LKYCKSILSGVALTGMLLANGVSAFAEELLDSTPIAQQTDAVSGINFTASLQTGVVGGYSNHMFVGSLTMPLGSSFGTQLDLAFGQYREDYTSAAGGLHIFWRDASVGMLGIYGDYGYVNPEHSGRVGIEGSIYNGRYTLDILAGVRFGQHVYTRGFDEIDLSYYFTDNFRGSIGHRGTSRGNVASLTFEVANPVYAGWSLYGDAEIGEDDYSAGHLGIRFALGSGSNASLIERDRQSSVKIRIPRGIADDTQCGVIATPKPKTWWRARMWLLCGSKEDLANEGAVIAKR